MKNLSDESRFSDDELAGLNVWNDLQSFGQPVQENDKPKILTVEEIEAVQQQAYDEAFAQGRQDGFASGKKEGFEVGQKEGLEAGKKQGAEQGYQENLHILQDKCQQFNALMEALENPFRQLDEQMEQELVTLAVGIARQLLRREIKIDPGQVVAVVKEAVKILPLASQKISLTLHPEDAELVRAALVLDEMSPPWGIREDPIMTRGGCIVESGASHVDASVEKRLAAIVASIMGGERKGDRPHNSSRQADS